MNIINIGILAHVDAGKTTLTESLLYTAGAVREPGSVDKGTARTDSMSLERQRGITIQASVTSLQWEGRKINIVDTPGHMDFIAEVQRSLSVLDGAVVLVSARDGVQAQTRILFHALREMKIPTILFINKIDQEGIDLPSVYQDIREKLSTAIVIKQNVETHPRLRLTRSTSQEQWDPVIVGNEELLEQYVLGERLDRSTLELAERRGFLECSLFPVYHGSAKNHIGSAELLLAVAAGLDSHAACAPAGLCGSVFKIEYPEKGRRLAYLRLYGGKLHTKETVAIAGRKETWKISEMRVPSNGGLCRVEEAGAGEIVILPDAPLSLHERIGDSGAIPRKVWTEEPIPMMRANIRPARAEKRESLLSALKELTDADPLLHFRTDSMTHEITLSFLGKVQMEIISALLDEKYHLDVYLDEPTVIYKERPLTKAGYTIHMAEAPNPFWASIGLTVEPLPPGSGICYISRVPTGYLKQSFQNAVSDGIRYGCEQGNFGWELTDCRISFEYGLYSSAVSTPSDFRSLAPIVLEQALRKCGTMLLEPFLAFTLYAPQSYMPYAYQDMKKYDASVTSLRLQNKELVFTGEIPARCIHDFRQELSVYTDGLGVCLTEPKNYRPAKGAPVRLPRRPNPRLDKTRHLFHKKL